MRMRSTYCIEAGQPCTDPLYTDISFFLCQAHRPAEQRPGQPAGGGGGAGGPGGGGGGRLHPDDRPRGPAAQDVRAVAGDCRVSCPF